MKNLKYYLMVAVLGVFGTSVGAKAASIGVQFLDATGVGVALHPPPSTNGGTFNIKAGVAAVAQTNWNSVTGPTDSRTTPITFSGLIDNTGAPTTAALSATGYLYGGGAGFNSSDPDETGDNDLADSQMLSLNGVDAVVSVTDIPYSQYDIYVYLSCDSSGRSGTVTIGSSSQSYITTNATIDPSQWVTTTDGSTANYLHFSGLTGSSQAVHVNVTGNGGVNGIQIVSSTGASIGVQFYENTSRGQAEKLNSRPPPPVNMKAGVAAVAQNNWNSIVAPTDTRTAPFTTSNLVDSTGVTTTAAVTESGYMYGASSGFGATDPNQVGDNALSSQQLLSLFGTAAVVDVTNIPYSQYDIYVYLAVDGGAAGRSGTVSIGSSSQSYLTTTVSDSGDTSQWITTVDGDFADYLVFTNLTGNSQEILVSIPANGGIDGFQIVQTGGSVAPSPIPLNVSCANGSVTLTWSNPAFKLQSASNVSGPYIDVAGASSPYTEPSSGAQKFYRLYWNGQ